MAFCIILNLRWVESWARKAWTTAAEAALEGRGWVVRRLQISRTA